MRKGFRLSHPVAIIVMLILIGGAAVAREDKTEEIKTVEDSVFQLGRTRRPPVVFLHDAHNEAAAFEYAACHHVYDEDGRLLENETSEDKECSECHAAKDDPRHLDLVASYHNLCKGCHEKEKKGPVMCSECHVKTK